MCQDVFDNTKCDKTKNTRVSHSNIYIHDIVQGLLFSTTGRDLYIAKNQKLCQTQNSKWKNFAKAKYWHLFQNWSVLQIQHNHVRFHLYHTVFNPYLELDFQNDTRKFSGKCLDILSPLIKLLQLFTGHLKLVLLG